MSSASEAMQWQVHPARERWRATCLAVTVIAAFGWQAGDLMECAGWGVFSGVFLLAALNRFFLPSRFLIDADGVTAQYPGRRIQYRWAEIRRFRYDERGGFLSRRLRPSLMDGFCGIHLHFRDNRDTVIARIKQELKREDVPSC